MASPSDGSVVSGPTPGPWYVFTQRERSPYQDHDDATTHEHHYVMKARGVTIAALNTTCLMYQNGAADARLIAAAPELLAALTALTERARREWLVDMADITPEITAARAAIRKATAPSDDNGASD